MEKSETDEENEDGDKEAMAQRSGMTAKIMKQTAERYRGLMTTDAPAPVQTVDDTNDGSGTDRGQRR